MGTVHLVLDRSPFDTFRAIKKGEYGPVYTVE